MEGFGREAPHSVRECVQLWVIPIKRDGSSWVSPIPLGIGVDSSQVNVISYSVYETVDRSVEDPVIWTGIGWLVDRTIEDLVLGTGFRRLLGPTLHRSVGPDDGTVGRPLCGDWHALDDGAVLVHARVGDAHPIGRQVSHPARVGNASPVGYLIGHLAGIRDTGPNESLIGPPQARITEAVADCVRRSAGIRDAQPIDDLVCSQARNRHTPPIH